MDIYGKDKYASNPHAKAVMQKVEKMGDKRIDVDAFRKFIDSYPALLFPAFEIQMKIQNGILGPEFWNHCSQRRVSITDGKYMQIRDLMELHVNKDKFKAIMEVI